MEVVSSLRVAMFPNCVFETVTHFFDPLAHCICSLEAVAGETQPLFCRQALVETDQAQCVLHAAKERKDNRFELLPAFTATFC